MAADMLSWIKESINHLTGADNERKSHSPASANNTSGNEEMVKSLERFGSTTVKQVMKSRLDIKAINKGVSYSELLKTLKETGYSRIPVYSDSLDQMEGYIHLKDILPFLGKSDDFKWEYLIRPPYFVPEGKKIEELLKEFQEKQIHMALVVDEYGGTAGLITLEDIMEEIIGEIKDEFDEDDLEYIKEDDRTWIFEGKISLNDFCKIVSIDPGFFQEVKGESESLGGLLLELNADLPGFGKKINYKNFVFEVISVNHKRVKKIRVYYNETANIEDTGN